MRVVVTGGSGFIGTHALAILCQHHIETHAISREIRHDDGVIWHIVDLFDPVAVDQLMQEIQPTHLLHLAWDVTPGTYWITSDNFRWVQASLHLLMAFHEHGGQRAVFAGTCAEYDWEYGYLIEEKTPIEAQTPYGICKASLYRMVMSYAKETQLSVAWGRIFFPFGPGEKAERLVPYVIGTLLAGKPAETTSGQQLRDFLYVKDVAQVFVTLLQHDLQGAINIASGNPLRLHTLITTIADMIGRPDLLHIGARPDGDQPYLLVGDALRLQNELNWSPAYSLQQGLEETIQWWQNQRGDG